MKVFIFIALYVLIWIVTSLVFIVFDYKNQTSFKDVDKYIERNNDWILESFIGCSVWPISFTVLAFSYCMKLTIKFVLNKVKKGD